MELSHDATSICLSTFGIIVHPSVALVNHDVPFKYANVWGSSRYFQICLVANIHSSVRFTSKDSAEGPKPFHSVEKRIFSLEP